MRTAPGIDPADGLVDPSDRPLPTADGAARSLRVMVYLPPEVHRAMKHFAVDAGTSVSDAFVDAAREFLAARGRPVPPGSTDGTPKEPGRNARAPSGIERAIERQERSMDAVMLKLDELRQAREPPRKPAGTSASLAMKAVLRALAQAGTAGLSAGELEKAMVAASVRSGASEAAKTILREAGVIRFEVRRWFVCT